VIAERLVIIPLRFVDQLIEYPRSALPLGSNGVAGIGVYQDALLVSLSIAPTRNMAPTTKGVLLRGLAPSTMFAIEVDRTLSFVDLSTEHATTPSAEGARGRITEQEPWLSTAISADGRQVLRLDVESLIRPYYETERAG
jgi:hypothetical protein